MRLALPRPTYANVVSTLALVLALGGTAYAANTVATADIQDFAVTTPKLANEAVTNAKIAPASVTASKVGANSLTLADIKGVDQTDVVSFTLAGRACTTLKLAVPSAVAGQAALLTWTSGLPSFITTSPARVSSTTVVSARACNESTATASVANLSVRVVTFG